MHILIEIISLQTARGRLLFAGAAHAALLLVPYHWLNNLSLYKLIGLTEVPSIGLTRSYWLLLRGDFTGAWERNWFIFPIMMAGWSIVAIDIYSVLRKKHGITKK